VTIESIASPDLPVIWWVFWLVVMAVGVFASLVWWLTRAALGEDAAPAADDDRPPDGRRPGHDEDREDR
jgi:hypothetical protein